VIIGATISRNNPNLCQRAINRKLSRMSQTAASLWVILALARRVSHRVTAIETLDALDEYVRAAGEDALSPERLLEAGRGTSLAVALRRAADMVIITREARADNTIMDVVELMWQTARAAEVLSTEATELSLAA
jgi:hypothetical protein